MSELTNDDDALVCTWCDKPIGSADDRTTINGAHYHPRCFDRHQRANDARKPG